MTDNGIIIMAIIHKFYDELISLENIFFCWDEFKHGKRKKPDVMAFERNLEDNIFTLHDQLKNRTYCHDGYTTFHIHDPKHRIISKATVKDRLVHHIIFNELYNIFEPSFIYHSYSSRLNKGTHLAIANLAKALRKISNNYRNSAFVLKCDIRKFFTSVSHQKLLTMIKNRINDEQFLWLTMEIINSFCPAVDKFPEREREY